MDLKTGEVKRNDAKRCEKRMPPASTFKVPHALIALETGVVKDAAAERKPLIGGWISEDTIWACTTCRACEEQCPVMITYVDKIVQMRRHLVVMKGRMLPTGAAPFRPGDARLADAYAPIPLEGRDVSSLMEQRFTERTHRRIPILRAERHRPEDHLLEQLRRRLARPLLAHRSPWVMSGRHCPAISIEPHARTREPRRRQHEPAA